MACVIVGKINYYYQWGRNLRTWLVNPAPAPLMLLPTDILVKSATCVVLLRRSLIVLNPRSWHRIHKRFLLHILFPPKQSMRLHHVRYYGNCQLISLLEAWIWYYITETGTWLLTFHELLITNACKCTIGNKKRHVCFDVVGNHKICFTYDWFLTWHSIHKNKLKPTEEIWFSTDQLAFRRYCEMHIHCKSLLKFNWFLDLMFQLIIGQH